MHPYPQIIWCASRPVEYPFCITRRHVYTAVTVLVAKAIMPVSAMQSNIIVKKHGVWHIFDKVVINFAFSARHFSFAVAIPHLENTFICGPLVEATGKRGLHKPCRHQRRRQSFARTGQLQPNTHLLPLLQGVREDRLD